MKQEPCLDEAIAQPLIADQDRGTLESTRTIRDRVLSFNEQRHRSHELESVAFVLKRLPGPRSQTTRAATTRSAGFGLQAIERSFPIEPRFEPASDWLTLVQSQHHGSSFLLLPG